MKSRLITLGFLIILLPGIYLDFKVGGERETLQAHYKRLTQSIVDMEIDDPTRAYIRAIKTDDPRHWCWRIHTPANFLYSYKHDGGSASGSTAGPIDFIAHFRFKNDREGRLERYVSFHGGSSRSSVGPEDYSRWLAAHMSELNVVQVGADKAVSFDALEPIPLLTIELPESLAKDPIAAKNPYPKPGKPLRVLDLIVNPPTATTPIVPVVR